MKNRPLAIAGAVVAVAGLALAGCSAGPSGPTSEIQPGTTLTVAQNQGFTSANGQTGDTNTTYNTNINTFTSSGFLYYDDQPKIVLNTKFGTLTKTSDSPLTVQYTIADGVKWSDGTPVDAVDLLLQWITGSTKFNDPGDGSITPATGVNFQSVAAGLLSDVQSKLPTLSDDHKTLTVVYDKPYIDWQLAMTGAGLPAHIVDEEAFGGDDATAAKKDVLDTITAADGGDAAALAKLATIATTWNSKWNFTDTPSDRSSSSTTARTRSSRP